MAEGERGGVDGAGTSGAFSFGSDGGNVGGDEPITFGNSTTIDPASLSGTGSGDGGGTGRRKPRSDAGQKRGPRGSGKAAPQTPLDLGLIEFALVGIHSILASSLNIEELELSKEEGTKLAEAVGKVSAHYPVAIDPKAQAWIALIMVAASVYGPRATTYYMRTHTEPKTPASVSPFQVVRPQS